MEAPACPVNHSHQLNNEPAGVWCEQCRIYYQWKELDEIEVDEIWDEIWDEDWE